MKAMKRAIAILAMVASASLFGEAEVFSSSTVSNLMDAAGWHSGAVPASDSQVVISGEDTVAILSPEATRFGSISLTDGATLIAGHGQTIPSLTLAAGTTFSVDYSRVMRYYPGHVSASPVRVGWMPPECSVSEIEDIDGYLSGATWDAAVKGSKYMCVTNIVVKSDNLLECQFQYFSADDGSYTKGVIVEFTKDSSGNIYVNVAENGARYFSGNKIGEDLHKGTRHSIASSVDATGYGVQKVYFSAPGRDGEKVLRAGSLLAQGVEGIEGEVAIDVAEGLMLDLSEGSCEAEVKIVKTGKGVIAFGEVLPSRLEVAEGVLALQYGVEYDMSEVVLGADAAVKVIIDGELYDALKIEKDNGKTEYKLAFSFLYTGNGSWGDIANWSGGNIPTSSDAAYVMGADTVLDINSAFEEMPKEIIVMDGATLKVSASVELPKITLFGASALIASAEVSCNSGEWMFSSYGDKIPAVSIEKNAILSVPGGSVFGGMNLAIFGTLETRGDGELILGYSPLEKEEVFGLVVDGGAIKVESGLLKFLCPDGKVIVPENTITFKNAKMEAGKGKWLYPRFCDTLPTEQSILFSFDNTFVDFATGYTVLRGSTRFEFKNGGGIAKSNTNPGNIAGLWITDSVTIDMKNGASFIYGEANSGGSIGGSALSFKPSEKGFVVLTVEDGVIGWHRTGGNSGGDNNGVEFTLGGNGNAKIKLNGTTFTAMHGTWSSGAIFDTIGEVEIGEKGLVISNSLKPSGRIVKTRLTGNGGLSLVNSNENFFELIIASGFDNTASGLLTAGENSKITIDSGAIWGGMADYSDNIYFKDWETSSTPYELTLGGLNLKKSLVFRVWENGNDVINFTKEGIINNGFDVKISLQNGYRPQSGKVVSLGFVPASFDIGSVLNYNQAWVFELVDNVDNPDCRVLQARATGANYVFNGGSGDEKIVDLNDPRGWSDGVVPQSQDVSIDNVEVIIMEGELNFNSITLKNGAKVIVRKPEIGEGEEDTYSGVALPLFELNDGTALIIDSNASATIASAPSVKVTDSAAYPMVKIEKGGCLSVSGNAKFGGIAMDIEGTLHSTGEGDLILGYSIANTTLPFNLAVNGGTIKAKSGVMKFLCPDGAITVPGNIITFTNATLVADDGVDLQPHFCDTLPVDQSISFLFDNTFVDFATGHYELCGSSVFCFSNGGGIKKSNTSPYNATSLTLKDRVAVKMSGGASFIYGEASLNGSHGGSAVFFNPSAEGFVSLDMKDGVLGLHRSQGNGNAKFSLNGVTFTTMHASWSRGGFFDKIGEVEVGEKGLVLLNDSNATRMDINAKLTGVGDVIVDNAKNNLFSVGGLSEYEHTSTGEISVVPDKNAAFVAYNGFSWAGTVVANGWMEIIDKIEGSTYTYNDPVSVSFGALDLQTDFPIKVWKENGRVVGNDTLDVGEYLNSGGRLVPEDADTGAELETGDSFTVGKIAKSSDFPRLPAGWIPVRVAIDGDADFDSLVIKKGRGFQIIVR